ncbi:MAG TPA: histidinol-phosphate transaminase [Candidatus Omnitrophica bacterium]|nr:histidinol-phosphate transaminase [Candidatus Omnitrophota bacterium]
MIRQDILNIEAYKPGKPIEEVERELGLKDVVKLASNENPLGPSPAALAAIRKNLKSLNRYPEGTCFYLKKKLAAKLGVKENNLLFGNGSDELIDIILKTIKGPDAEIITSDTTFVEYKICGAINGFDVTAVPLKDFTFDLEAIRSKITKRTKAVFIANPNNPTGTFVNAKQVADFLDGMPRQVLVVFDEAYFEFVTEKDFPEMIPLIEKKNVIVLRTFSKAYGLAGLRIGYMAASEKFIGYAQRVRQPFNVNSLAQAAATAALNDKKFLKRTRECIAKEKKLLYKAFLKLGVWFKDSSANFIFVRLEKDAGKVFQLLLKKGVIIREMSQYGLTNYARITVGTRQENIKLIKGLDEVLNSK